MKISSPLLVVFSSFIIKISPIIFGAIILSFKGAVEYGDFVYLLVFCSTSTTLLSSGLAPALCRGLAGENDKNKMARSIGDYFFANCLAIFIYYVGIFFWSNKSNYEILIITTIVASNTIAILITNVNSFLGLHKDNIISGLCLVSLSILSLLFLDYEYTVIYSFSLLSFSLSLLFFLWRKKFLYLGVISCNKLLSIVGVYRVSLKIMIPNAISLLSILSYHNAFKSNASTESLYSYFALGYQVFSVFVFIPNALTPLAIKFFSQNDKGPNPVSISLLVLIFCVSLSLFLTLPFWWIEGNTGLLVFLLTLLSGAISASIVPLSQFLITKKMHAEMLQLSLIIAFILYLFSTFSSFSLEYGFFVSYAMGYIYLLLAFKKKGY